MREELLLHVSEHILYNPLSAFEPEHDLFLTVPKLAFGELGNSGMRLWFFAGTVSIQYTSEIYKSLSNFDLALLIYNISSKNAMVDIPAEIRGPDLVSSKTFFSSSFRGSWMPKTFLETTREQSSQLIQHFSWKIWLFFLILLARLNTRHV